MFDHVALPSCSPPVALSPPLGCNPSTALGTLCTTVSTIIEKASCEELGTQAYVQKLIEGVGLAGDMRGRRIYGTASKLMRRVGSHTGLWQDPQQISRALLVLGSVPRRPSDALEPFRYVEVGVYTAWTCVIVSSYLKRTQGKHGFEGLAVDVKVGNIAQGTFDLMKRLNIGFEGRGGFNKRLKEVRDNPSNNKPVRFDACFIDGAHDYSSVKGDYAQLAPLCGATMFHDIQDSSTMIDNSGGGTYSGGVPMFWAHARGHVKASRAIELTMQGAPYWPVFGIGVILPGPTWTAEPDDGRGTVSMWPKWKGDGAPALYRALCTDETPAASPEHLPPQYVARSVLCPIANATNLESLLAATKRSVPKPLLEYAMGLPWNKTRARR